MSNDSRSITINNECVDGFIETLKKENRSFSDLNEEDKNIIEKIHENYDSICQVESGQDVYSLHLIATLDDFIFTSLSTADMSNSGAANLFIDENLTSLSGDYYKLLSKYFDSLAAPKEKSRSLDDVKWIKSILSYIDRECNMLKMASDFSFKQSLKSISQSKDSIIESIKATKEQLSLETEKTQEAESKLKLIYESVSDLMPNMLTVLSIFVGAIISIFVVYITIFLTPDKENSKYLLLDSAIQLQMSKYVLSGHILGNILFLLLFMSATITNRSILTSCNSHEFAKIFSPSVRDYVENSYKFSFRNCKHKCSPVKKVLNRAGYILAFNLLMAIFYIVLYIWWVIEKYWSSSFADFLQTPHFIIVSILLLLCFFPLFWHIIRKYRKRNKYKTAIKKERCYIKKIKKKKTIGFKEELEYLDRLVNFYINKDKNFEFYDNEIANINEKVARLLLSCKEDGLKLKSIFVRYKDYYNVEDSLKNFDIENVSENINLFNALKGFIEKNFDNK